MDQHDGDELAKAHSLTRRLLSSLEDNPYQPLCHEKRVSQAADSLVSILPEDGYGLEETHSHLVDDVIQGLNGSSLASSYYGFVTGGVTPAARIGEVWASVYDQNVAVHLPKETVATIVEDRALTLLLQLLEFEPSQWPVRVLTTGATASNILGLACGRQYVITKRLKKLGKDSVDGEGLLSACRRALISDFCVLSNLPHSSISKAANIVGLGSSCIVNVARDEDVTRLDVNRVREYLLAADRSGVAAIVAISCGEVNTGAFATRDIAEVQELRDLCDQYGAWLHVDGAFGIFARVLPEAPEYTAVRQGVVGLHLADSITGDGHKMLNVPYDSGFFFSRHRELSSQVFGNPGATYLKGNDDGAIQSPLNIGIENSRRFRGLPLYTTLVSEGRLGYSRMVHCMVRLARKVCIFIEYECPELDLLPLGRHKTEMESIFNVVLFRAKEISLNTNLVRIINGGRLVYISGTSWDGKPAARIAIAKWNVDVEKDFEIIARELKRLVNVREPQSWVPEDGEGPTSLNEFQYWRVVIST